MQANFLEELVAEWYEYQGYLVKRNERVGPNPNGRGGHQGELDVVAFDPTCDPKRPSLVHIETSMDADSWRERDTRLRRKFAAGDTYIKDLFDGLPVNDKRIHHVGIFVSGNGEKHKNIGGGEVRMASDLIVEVLRRMRGVHLLSHAVPEKYPILRTLQIIATYWRKLADEVNTD